MQRHLSSHSGIALFAISPLAALCFFASISAQAKELYFMPAMLSGNDGAVADLSAKRYFIRQYFEPLA
jgi:outer membrane usher protein FimD/PapC